MDKINFTDISHSQMQVAKEMQRMMALAGSSMAPASNNFSSLNGAGSVPFSTVFQQGLKNVDNLQHSASAMQRAVDIGQSDDLMGTMLESQKASISFSAMVEIRNKLATALDQLINTPL